MEGPTGHGPGAEEAPEWSQPYFGDTVKRMRIERGLSQRDLAGEGISTGYLSRLERGERPPTRQAATYLAGRLGVPPEILAGTGPGGAEGPAGSRERELSRLMALAASADSDARGETTLELTRQLDKGGYDNPETVWHALWQTADYYGAHGEYAAERAPLERLRELSDELAEPHLSTRAYTQLARCQLVLGDTRAALDSAEHAYALAGGLPPEESGSELIKALTTLIAVESESGNPQQATEHADRLLELVERAPTLLRVRALWNIAMADARAGSQERASAVMETALAVLDSRDDPVLWVRLRLAAVSLYLQVDPPRLEASAELLGDARQALRYVGSERHSREELLLEARLAMEQGEYARARESVDALEGRESLLGYRDLARLAVVRGQLLIVEGRRAAGVQLLEERAREAQQSGNIELAASIWRTLAQTLAQQESRRSS
jgi:transcriptional regulator with XRE-family HTH domain